MLLARYCTVAAIALLSSVSMAAAPKKALNLDAILKMHAAASRNEKPSSRNLSAKKDVASAAASCTIGGGHCSFDSDCCSDNCASGICQAGSGGCTIGGGSCSFDSDCCSDNCHSGTCQAGSGKCTDGGGSCSFDSDCCSDNCYSGTCQSACTSQGDSCTYDHECCAGNCNSVGRCGAEPDPRCN
jgi:hypothetical protein